MMRLPSHRTTKTTSHFRLCLETEFQGFVVLPFGTNRSIEPNVILSVAKRGEGSPLKLVKAPMTNDQSPEQLRHKPSSPLDRPRELVLACPAFKSQVNLSRIVRLAGCVAVERMIACGTGKIDPAIARDGGDQVVIERRRTLLPVLKKLKQEKYRLVGLEQTNRSRLIFEYSYQRRTALVIGHERLGMTDEELALMDDLIEIPVYGLPYSYNVVTATTMAVYEYCRQFPAG
jgi:tRNA G18 (ribose-2'-O)-methylase SpoU